MRTPPVLPTLSTMALALACAALMVVADAALASASAQRAPVHAPRPLHPSFDNPMNTRLIDTATESVVTLRADEMAHIRGAARLHVARGLLWLTIDGEHDDHMLRAGEGYTLGGDMRGLMEALDAPANIVIVDARPSWSQRAMATWRAAMQRNAVVTV